MAKKSADIQREIDEIRQRLDRKVEGLSERLRSDARTTSDTVEQDMRERLHVAEYAEERPLLTMAAAFGSGIVLGTLTPGLGSIRSSNGQDGHQQSQRQQDSQGGGIFDQLLGTAGQALGTSIQQQVNEVFRSVTSGKNGSGEGRRSES